MKTHFLRAIVVLTVLGGACSGDEHYDLDVYDPLGELDPSLRRRMDIRVVPEYANPNFPEDGVTPDAFSAFVFQICAQAAGGLSLCGGSDCAALECMVEASLCTSHHLLTIVEQVDALQLSSVEPFSSAGVLTVPPQDDDSNAALATLAYRHAAAALEAAGEALGSVCTPAELNTSWESEHARSVFFATAYGESFDVASEAMSAYERAAYSLSDSVFADFGQVAEASRQSMIYRRSVALLSSGGFSNGIPGTSSGMCVGATRTSEVDVVIGMIRRAAPDPRELLDDTKSIDEFVLEDLAARLAINESAPTLSLAVSAEEVYSNLGLARDVFMAAREFLRGELRAFERALDAEAPPLELPGDPTTGDYFQRYAALASEPEMPSRAYYDTAGSYSSGGIFAGSTAYETTVPFGGWHDLGSFASFANLTDGFLSGITRLTTRTDVQLGTSAAAVRDVLAGLAADGDTLRTGRIDACYEELGPSTRRAYVRVFSEATAANTEVVLGHAGLQCAVRGTVEGAPCELSDYMFAAPSETHFYGPAGAAVGAGYSTFVDRYLYLDGLPSSTDLTNATRMFVVIRRPGTPGLAGDYEELGGVTMPHPTPGTTGFRYCIHHGIAPSAQEIARRALARSPENCGESAESCAGVPWDQLIPLENELTSDGDAVESSWRHYLTRAREAADFADGLGEEVIRAGLEMDIRSEGAIDQLEQLCGVAINVTDFGALASLPRRGTAPAGDVCPDAGYRVQDGQCILDPLLLATSLAATDADAARLASCLGADSTVPWATVGNAPLCIWPSGPNEFCGRADADHPCPYEADSSGFCSPAGRPPDITGLPIPVPVTLGLFHMPNPADLGPNPSRTGETNNTTTPCEVIARGRAAVLTPIPAGATPFFDASHFGSVAQSLSWAASVGDYSSVLWNNGVLYSTGSEFNGPSNRWPCMGIPTCEEREDLETCVALAGCEWTPGSPGSCEGTVTGDALCPSGQWATDPTSYTGPLFCLRDVCGGDAASAHGFDEQIVRARMNDLLARAVMAAHILGGVSLAGIEVPYYVRSRDERVSIPDPPNWMAPATPVPGYGAYGYQRSMAGSFEIYDGDFGEFNFVTTPYADIEAIAERILGASNGGNPSSAPSALSSIEWSSCPYDGVNGANPGPLGCVEFFDDAVDLDDSLGGARWNDRNMPFLVRALPVTTDGSDSETAATRLWTDVVSQILANPRREGLAVPAARALFEGDSSWSDLSHYWWRSQCGRIEGGACDNFGRHPDELVAISVDQARCFTDSGDDGSGACSTIGCRNFRYNACVREAEPHGIDFASTFDGNRAFIAPHGLTNADLLNGMELLCQADRVSSPSNDFGCPAGPPDVTSVSDLYVLEAFLRCKGARIRASAASAIVRDLPSRVVEIVQRGGAGGSPAEGTGEYGAATLELAAAYIALRDSEETIARTLDDMANAIDAVRNAIERSGIERRIQELNFASEVADRVTQCVVAAAAVVADSATLGKFTGTAGATMAMAATCVNTGIQIGLSSAVHDLRGEELELAIEAEFLRFDTTFNTLSGNLSTQSTAIQTALLRISAAHERLTVLRENGRRAVARALFLESDETERQFAVNSVIRGRYNTALHRYAEAHERAVRLTFIARRALEQRLGMRLSSMTEPLITVDAPSEWEATLCSLPSIDYDRVRMEVEAEEEADAVTPPDGYAGAYVGDYVRRLEQVFESYSFAFPFADGTDTVVVSLRDDVRSTREECDVAVPNLLLQSGSLGRLETTESPGWRIEGCSPVAADPPAPGEPQSPPPTPGCVAVTSTEESATAPGALIWGGATSQRVEFGLPDVSCVLDDDCGDAYTCSASRCTNPIRDAITSESRLAQWLDLTRGRYRVSWYGRSATWAPMSARIDPEDAVHFSAGGSAGLHDHTPTNPTYIFSSLDSANPGWTRYWYFADVAVPGEGVVTIEPAFGTTPAYRAVDLAGLMVEDVTRTMAGDPAQMIGSGMSGTIYLGDVRGPGAYYGTANSRVRRLPVCTDTDGDVFRRDAWTYGCVSVCPDGYDGSCERAMRERCFWQTTLSASSDVYQRLAGGSSAGFAAGNYNYRFETIGVNLVGTGLRDCSRIGGGLAGCYASGNIAYSILHDGPYPVRNARGDVYDAPLFRGRIESARALAAERYLTNPLSGADAALLAPPYTRTEFRGRPMGGTLILRIWDEDGFVFENLEDVQLIVGYRYWQHQR